VDTGQGADRIRRKDEQGRRKKRKREKGKRKKEKGKRKKERGRRVKRVVVCSLSLTLASLTAIGQSRKPQVHRLEATPSTVAYGYYWAEAKPALRIASGDIIDVDTMLTNTPAGLQKAGLAPERIQPSLAAIVGSVTGDKRGPGGHILTGPVFVEGAEPGDVLEVKVL
jgi:hypothetical protein